MTLPEQKVYTLFDFSKPDYIAQWYARDDIIMGGVSDSRLLSTGQDTAVFAGNVSLENNGGFAAVRSRDASYDLSPYTFLSLRIKGDGKHYSVNIRTEDSVNGVRYQASFYASNDEWMTKDIPLHDFVAARRGKRPSGAPLLDLQRIRSFGFIIANKQEGLFRLEIAWMKAY